MKYVALLTNQQDDIDRWLRLTREEAQAARAVEVPKWEALFSELGPTGELGYGAELELPSTAKIVRVRDGETIVTDGPYAETKEQIGGLMEIRAVFRARLDSLPAEGHDVSSIPDDRLALVFTCCHPALAAESRVALTLREVAGLTTPEIARAFLVAESAMAQRLVRAKRKIRGAGIPFRVPPASSTKASRPPAAARPSARSSATRRSGWRSSWRC